MRWRAPAATYCSIFSGTSLDVPAAATLSIIGKILVEAHQGFRRGIGDATCPPVQSESIGRSSSADARARSPGATRTDTELMSFRPQPDRSPSGYLLLRRARGLRL